MDMKFETVYSGVLRVPVHGKGIIPAVPPTFLGGFTMYVRRTIKNESTIAGANNQPTTTNETDVTTPQPKSFHSSHLFP